ncbi:leucyl aminopeptidase [Polaromonas sp. YR568]|uniref:leucyl aminopeptidase n=1 Tax=Polaromonas sp. YR568 TaxID=1855301 RepID=UPI003137DE8E
MDFELKTMTPARLCAEKTDALVALVGQTPASDSDALSSLIAQALKARDFEAKPGKLLAAYRPAGLAATRVVLAGVGDGSPKNIRSAITAAMGGFKGGNVQHVTVCLANASLPTSALARAVVLAGSDAAYSYTTTRSKPGPAMPVRMTLVADSAAAAKALQQGMDTGVALAKGIELAKEWANRPANHATPVLLAGAAKALGKLKGIKVDVLGPKEVEKLGMGSFMAVAQGTAQPLRFIVLHYQGAAKTAAPVVLVGKGITFDTGGISIKPAAEMDEMKFDMCGAASVLGTFRALAELQPTLNVVGLIPACENMPGGRAVKPGDVVTSMSGQTIEILNTDAEGRLVLCDALTYAERFKPRAVVDIATLTGACVIALGGVRSGMFATDDALADALHQAGEASMDLCWRMPLDEDYADGLKTHFADVANVAGRAAGAVTAAKFLQRFATSFPWAHLDIAGTAWKSGAAKGATGRPVGLLVEYLLGEAGRPAVKERSKAKAASAPRGSGRSGVGNKA